jgi:hypothetical protein
MGALQRVWLRPQGWVGILVLGALLERPAVAAPLAPVPAVHDIDWPTSPLDLNLRGLNGERFRFHCPSGKAKPGQVIGKGPYTDGSSICAAGVHAGVIHAASGGLVTIELRPGEAHYAASWSHFIQSESYEGCWSGSFLVIAPDGAGRPPSLPSPCMVQSVFNGTWRPDPEVFSPARQPDVAELANGFYDCQTCTPPYKIKADGQDEPISGNPYYDTLSITTVDDRTVMKTAKKVGKVIAKVKVVVSTDGKTKTEVQTMYDMAPRPIEMTTHSSRVSAGSHGSHVVSGAWRMTDSNVSNHAEDTIFRMRGDKLEMSDQMGRTFSAKLDGTEAPYNGSDEFSGVSLKMIDSHTIEELDKKDGKVVKIDRWSVDPDGKTMHVRFDNTKGFVQEQTGHKVE